MEYSSDEESDISESEIVEYKEKPYEQLKTGKCEVEGTNGTLRYPFCSGKKKQDYSYEELLPHASGVPKGSANRSAKQKANHLALAKYLEIDLASESNQASRQVELKLVTQTYEDDDLFVWPWAGIITNIVTVHRNENDLGDGAFWLKMFSKYKPIQVRIFWNDMDQTALAVVRFNKDWTGFMNAIAFEKAFEADCHGKREWDVQKQQSGSHIYGWVACADDYSSQGPVGEYLCSTGQLKTIFDVVEGAKRDSNTIVENLTNGIDLINKDLDEWQCKYNENTMSLIRLLEEEDKLVLCFL